MSNEQPALDIDKSSREEFVARSIAQRLLHSSLQIKTRENNQIFEIYVDQKIVLKIDKYGIRYSFPTRRKRYSQWIKMVKKPLPRIIEQSLLDLTEADYQVLSSSNNLMRKKPMHISRYTRCPICNEKGGIKVILHSDNQPADSSEIFAIITRSQDINGAEMKCTLCGWIGIREELPRKSRYRYRSSR